MNLLSNSLEKIIEDILFYDKENAVENIMRIVFEAIFKAERRNFLDNSPQEGNKANGYYERILKSVNKYLTFKIPRDRLGCFKPVFLEVLKEKDYEITDLALMLYKKGLTTRDIEEVMKDAYGKKMSPSSVSNIVKDLQVEREAWHKKKLDEKYYFVYIDAIQIALRRETVEKEAFYAVIGLKEDLTREILGLYNIPQESAEGWESVLNDLKERGVKQVQMFVADGLTGLENVVKRTFKASYLQKCLFHKMKNVLLKVRAADKQSVAHDMNEVFKREDPRYTEEMGRENLKKFLDKWKKSYPGLKSCFKEEHLENYFAYLHFPYQIHRMIYTTNWVERLNKSIRRVEKMRNSFPNPDSALNLVYGNLMDFEQRVYKFPVTSFKVVQDILNDRFQDCSFSDT